MRFFLPSIAVVVCLYMTDTAFARKYGMAGCGLGSAIFSPDGGQISAATTNSSFSSQGFGITSGTSNCQEPKDMAALKAQEEFFADNLSSLSKEMAKGSGESLQSLAAIFGCEKAIYSHFTTKIQASYQDIFKAPGAVATLNSLRRTMKGDALLNKGCHDLI